MSVELTNLDRVLWPQTGTTKGDLVAYYRAVAPVILPHLARRPLTLWRYPQGVDRRGFWQNECRGAPAWLSTAEIRGQRFCVANDLPSLVWLANLSTVELHPFLSPVTAPEQPTAVVFALDPGPPATVLDCCAAALRLRDRLRSRGLDSFPKTSGRSGLHVFAPVRAGVTYDETKALARQLADELAEESALVVSTASRAARRGKVFVDWLQNDPTRSTVAPYSLRGASLPTASTPVTWDEVEGALASQRPEALVFLARDALVRVDELGDLFAGASASP
jgi:bifunctional non-homologous end joining protein LigD